MILSPLSPRISQQLGTERLGWGSTSHLSRHTRHREIREADIGDEAESSSGVWSKSFKKTFLRAGSVKMSEGLSDIDKRSASWDLGPQKRCKIQAWNQKCQWEHAEDASFIGDF